MKASKGYAGLTPAEQRAARDQRLAEQAGPYAAQEASKYEARFLKNLTNARDDFEWIKANEAWKTLGHETFTSWWEIRVAPIMSALSMRPSRAVASEVVDRALADDATAPEDERRGTGKIAQLAGVDRKTVQRRAGAAMSHPDTSATQDSPAADLIEPSHAGVPAVGGQPHQFVGDRDAAELNCRTCGQFWSRPIHTDLEERDEEEVPCFECSAPLDPRDAADGYYKCLDCDPERLFRVATDTPAAGVTSLPDGEGDPTPEPEQQPGHNSPTGLEAAQPRDGRSETDSSAGPDQPVATTVLPGIDHHDGAGVSLSGEALPVESAGALLEDGDAAVTPSSSDYLMHLFASLVHGLSGLDAEALGPQLLGEEMELLHQHVDDVTHFVSQLGRSRFTEMTRTP